MGKPLFRWPREGGFLRPRAGRPAGGCQGSLAAFAPCPVGQGARQAGGGPLPVKGDSFRIERIPLDNPEEKFWGRFDSAPRPLLRPKEGLRPFLWKPAWGYGDSDAKDVGTGDESPERSILRRFRTFRLAENEIIDSPVVLNRHWVIIALRGTGERHAVPRAWPPPAKFRAKIWGVGQVVVPYGAAVTSRRGSFWWHPGRWPGGRRNPSRPAGPPAGPPAGARPPPPGPGRRPGSEGPRPPGRRPPG